MPPHCDGGRAQPFIYGQWSCVCSALLFTTAALSTVPFIQPMLAAVATSARSAPDPFPLAVARPAHV